MKVLSLRKYVIFNKNMLEKMVLGGELGAPKIIKFIQNTAVFQRFSYLEMYRFYDIVNLYECQEKRNIAYWQGPRAKSEDFRDDFRGSQGRNNDYYGRHTAKVDDFH